MRDNEIIIDTIENARTIRNWVRANKVYDTAKATKTCSIGYSTTQRRCPYAQILNKSYSHISDDLCKRV